MEKTKKRIDEGARPIIIQSFGVPQYVLIVLLVISSFLLGSLYTKVGYLEQSPSQAAAIPAADAPQQQPAPEVGEVPEITDRDHVRGNPNADVAMIVYSDTECPFCKRFHETMAQVMDAYGDKVKFVWRHYPLSFHANAQKEAEASECAYELGGNDAFWKYIDAIMERTTSNGTGFALDELGPLAAEIGLNQAKFQKCLDDGKYAQYVKDDMSGGVKAGVQGTPGTIVWNLKTDQKELISGALPLETIKQTVDSLL